MSGSGPRRLDELLQSGDISRLTAEAAERRRLAARIRAELPGEVASHVVGAHIDEAGRLVVAMDSSAWAARLRYSRTELSGRSLKVRVALPGDPENAAAADAQSTADGAS